MASMWPPKKGVAFTLCFSLYKSDGTVIANPGTLTRAVSVDLGAVDETPANAVTEEDTTYGQLSWVLSTDEMNGDIIWVYCKDDTAGCVPFTATLYTVANTQDEIVAGTVKAQVDAVAISGDTGAADALEDFFDDSTSVTNLKATFDGSTGYGFTGCTMPTTTTVTNGVTLGADAITAAKIADDAFSSEHFATGALTDDAVADSFFDCLAADTDVATAVWANATGAATYAAVVTDAAGTNIAADIIALQTDVGDAGAGLTAIPTVATVTTVTNMLTPAAILDHTVTDHNTADTVGERLNQVELVKTQADKIPASDGTSSWNNTALAAINAEVDTALNTAIPGSPTSDSINERIKAIDDLTQASGGGDLAAVKVVTDKFGFTGTSPYYVKSDVVDIAGAAVSTTTAQIGVNTVSLSNNAITAAAVQDAAIDAATFAADVDAEVAGYVWNAAIASYGTTGTYGEAAEAVTTELAKVPKSDSNVSWNTTALAAINAEVDTALNTAIPGSPTADSINERVKALDVLTEASGDGDLAAILVDTGTSIPATLAGLATTEDVADAVADEVITSGHDVAGSLAVLVADIPSTSEFEARTLPSADYVVVGDTIAGVTTVATTTTVTNDVGITQAGADKVWGTTARTLTAIDEDSTTLDIDAAIQAVIETNKLDHLVAVADDDAPVNNSIIAKLVSKDATADWSDFNNTTDSLEAAADTMATAAELAKVPKSDSNVSWNVTALAAINAEVDTALNTAIPGSPTADSINERVKAIDVLTEASGAGDLAAILTDTGTTIEAYLAFMYDWILNKLTRTDNGDGTVTYRLYADNGTDVQKTWVHTTATGTRAAAT